MDSRKPYEGNPMDVFFALAFQKTLLDLAKQDNSDWGEAIQRIARTDSETLKAARVSVWLYNERRSEIVCECLYQSSTDEFDRGMRILAKDYPRYFQAIEENRTVSAADALTDPRTSEFAEGYLKPLDITSMMDVPIRLHGKVIGVVCHEHTGPMRDWTLEDQEFAASIADLLALSFEASRRRRVEAQLRKKIAQLEILTRKLARGKRKTKKIGNKPARRKKKTKGLN